MFNRKVILLLMVCICLGGFGIFLVMDGIQDGVQQNENKRANESPVVETTPAKNDISLNKDSISDENTKKDLDTAIYEYLYEQGIDESEIAIFYQRMDTNESFELNVDDYYLSGSIYKVPLAMLYYEQLNAKEISSDDVLLYSANSYEEGGPIGSTYSPGSYISVSTLLYHTIMNSDNTAARILFNNLGGWTTFRDMIKKYDVNNSDSEFFYENEFTARYTNEVLYYLYNHADEYSELIENMEMTCRDSYLNQNLEVTIAQKYGSYSYAENAIGIVYDDIPYIISIFTSLSYGNGMQVIGDINELCYNYTNS